MMFEWFARLPFILRLCVVAFLLLFSTLLFMIGYFRTGGIGWAIGFCLLVFSFPSDSEKKGYHH